MYNKNSPEALFAMNLNQAEGLLFDFQWLAMSTPNHELYLQRDYTSAAATAGKPPEEKAVKRWIGALRALGRSAGRRLKSTQSLPTGARSSRRMLI